MRELERRERGKDEKLEVSAGIANILVFNPDTITCFTISDLFKD